MSESSKFTRRNALRLTGGVIAGSAVAGTAAAETTVNIVASDETPATGDNVTFEAANFEPDSDYEQYSWGIQDSDGNFISSDKWGETIDFTFEAADTYTISVIAASDYDAARTTAQTEITVDEKVEIVPSNENPDKGEVVTFEAKGYDPNSDYEQYSWGIQDADGNFVSSDKWGKTIEYTFSERGVYTVSIIAASDYEDDRALDDVKIGV